MKKEKLGWVALVPGLILGRIVVTEAFSPSLFHFGGTQFLDRKWNERQPTKVESVVVLPIYQHQHEGYHGVCL